MLYGYETTILQGAWLTLQVALLSLLIAATLGLLAALGRLSANRALRALTVVYTTIIRGIPDLVLMLLVFYGGQILVNAIADRVGYEEYIDISAFTAGVATIGFIFGAYMAETFRGAILAVERGQLEAASAFGMSPWGRIRRIMLPQMMLHALPGFTNNWLILLKATALVSIIGLNDMVRVASLAGASTKKPFVFFLAVSAIFLLFTSVSLWGLRRLARHYRLEEQVGQ